MLALAEDASRPLLERVKFVVIYTQELDEFFQVRVSGLEEQVEAGVTAATPDGMARASSSRPSVSGCRRPGRRARRRRTAPCAREAAHPDRALGQLDAEPGSSWGDGSGSASSGAHAALGRPRAPVPLHLEPVPNLAAAIRDPLLRRPALREWVKIPPLLPRFTDLPRRRAVRAARRW